MLKHFLILIFINSALSGKSGQNVSFIDKKGSSIGNNLSSDGSNQDENEPLLLTKPEVEPDMNSITCSRLRNFNSLLNKKTYSGSFIQSLDQAKEWMNGTTWFKKDSDQISDIDLKDSFEELCKKLEIEQYTDEDFAMFLAKFINTKDDCFTNEELIAFIYFFLENDLAKNNKNFVHKFVYELNNKASLKFMKDMIKAFLDCDKNFLIILEEQYKQNKEFMMDQFALLYAQVLYLKKAQTEDGYSQKARDVLENALRTGGIYVMLYAYTDYHYDINNPETSSMFNFMCKTGLMCAATFMNKAYSYIAKKKCTGYVQPLNNTGDGCMLATTDLLSLSNKIREDYKNEIEKKKRKMNAENRKSILKNKKFDQNELINTSSPKDKTKLSTLVNPSETDKDNSNQDTLFEHKLDDNHKTQSKEEEDNSSQNILIQNLDIDQILKYKEDESVIEDKKNKIRI